MANDRLRTVPERLPSGVVTLVDSNVLLDILTEDPTWSQWSGAALAAARDAGMLVINPIVYAEISVRFDRIGAHAAVCAYQLLTRDSARYRSYFPRLAVVAPDSSPAV